MLRMITSKSGNIISIRMNDEEDFFENLKEVVKEFNLKSGIFICALGMLKNVRLNYLTYPKESGKYTSKDYEGPFELTSLVGDIGFFDDELVVHAHAVLSDQENNCIGGHLAKGTVNATLEAFILVPETKFKRHHDEKTGLKILDLE